jgi:hypothetical protein
MNIVKWINNKNYEYCVGNGWHPLLIQLSKDIIKLDSTVSIAQVKEKFGGLRFYINGGTDEIYSLIEKAEQESLTICEECGTKENVTTKGHWIITLCDKCRKEREKI